MRPGKEPQNFSEDELMKSCSAEQLGESNETKLENDVRDVENDNKALGKE